MTNIKYYEITSNLILECPEELRDQIEIEFLDALVDVVEKHQSFIGGGFRLREVSEQYLNGEEDGDDKAL